ncbi:MAG TPA: hypothetical protein VJ499_14585 [Flavisolibacter sp.]|nr:hypothetical protein [Flavisolibacter sp.]
MKKLLFVLFVSINIGMLACRNHNNTSLTVKDSRRYYYMEASYNKDLTHDVERYMNDKISALDPNFLIDGPADRQFTLGDQTSFYLRNEPGYVELKLDKDENSIASYHRVRSICQGIKEILTRSNPINH